jgi:hypothetical protein
MRHRARRPGSPYRVLHALALAVALSLCLVEARGLPSRLKDADFWRIVSEFSEPGGYFPANNFVSNEMEYQSVIPRLKADIKPGGVYLGVGPDQNFTYIAALRPAMVFIVDIRRQNMLQHLMYKALFELSPTRADFLSRLFGRAKPEGLDKGATAEALVGAYGAAPGDPALFTETRRRVLDLLERQHRFALTPDDVETIGFLLGKFFEHGPELTYAPVEIDRPFLGPAGLRLSMFPSYAELATRSDGAGTNHGYLASEANYAFLRDLERRNLVVPIVGDFAGDKALAAVGRYVRDRGAAVTAIYTSNVEQYLFQNDVWRTYYENVARLPTDDTSTFIRSFFPYGGRIRINPLAAGWVPGTSTGPTSLYLYPESSTLTSPVTTLLDAVRAGAVGGYLDVIGLSK